MFVTREPKASYSQTSRIRINLKQMSIFYRWMFQNSCFTKTKIVLTISLTSSSNPEGKVYIGDRLGMIWS